MTDAAGIAAARKASKKTRGHAKGVFHRYLKTFNAQLAAGAEEDAMVTIMVDLERAYSEVEDKHRSLMEHYDSEDEEDDTKSQVEKDQVKLLNEDMDTVYQELCTARNDSKSKEKRKETSGKQ